MAAVNSTVSNWEPGGNFISEDYIFAMGAVNCNKFWVTSRKAWPGPAPVAPVAGALPAEVEAYDGALHWRNAAAAAVLPNPGLAVALGQPIFIPRVKYYFQSVSDQTQYHEFTDYQMDASGDAYGQADLVVMRQ